jgi:four helix bundle protein
MASQDLRELRVYQHAMELGETVWTLVGGWNHFAREAMGLQVIRAADSVAANISEGFGRHSFKENARFCYFARGSLRETAMWIEKACNRKLISNETGETLLESIQSLRKQLDRYIRSIGRTPTPTANLHEEAADFGDDDLLPLEEFLVHLETPAPSQSTSVDH